MLQLYRAGRTEHMFLIKGVANVAPGGSVELYVQNSAQNKEGQGKVFQAYKRQDGDWSVRYMHPLSCFQ
eukprot:5683793-Pleurochrysis_carterae.AAC.1